MEKVCIHWINQDWKWHNGNISLT